MSSRSMDDLVTSTEHAEPLHPMRELWRQHFYLDNYVNNEGGLWLVMLNALLVVPLIMAAFFYPVEAAIILGGVMVAAFVAYEGYVLWKKRRVRG